VGRGKRGVTGDGSCIGTMEGWGRVEVPRKEGGGGGGVNIDSQTKKKYRIWPPGRGGGIKEIQGTSFSGAEKNVRHTVTRETRQGSYFLPVMWEQKKGTRVGKAGR